MIKHVSWEGIICRVVAQLGGVTYFSTPHGSIYKMGLAHNRNSAQELTKEQRKQAVDYIIDARKQDDYKTTKELHEICRKDHEKL